MYTFRRFDIFKKDKTMLFWLLCAAILLNQCFVYSMECTFTVSEHVLIVYMEKYIIGQDLFFKKIINSFQDFNKFDLKRELEKIQGCEDNIVEEDMYLFLLSEKNEKAKDFHSTLINSLTYYKNILNLVLINKAMNHRFGGSLKKIHENIQNNIDNLMINWVPLMCDHCFVQCDYDSCARYFGQAIMHYIGDFSKILPFIKDKQNLTEIEHKKIDFLNIMGIQQLLLLTKHNVLEKQPQNRKKIIANAGLFLKNLKNKKYQFYFLIPVDPLHQSSLLKYVSDQNGIHITYEYFPVGVSAVTLCKNQLIKSPNFLLPDCI